MSMILELDKMKGMGHVQPTYKKPSYYKRPVIKKKNHYSILSKKLFHYTFIRKNGYNDHIFMVHLKRNLLYIILALYECIVNAKPVASYALLPYHVSISLYYYVCNVLLKKASLVLRRVKA